VIATILWFLAQAEEEAEPVNDAKDLYPHWEELLVGALRCRPVLLHLEVGAPACQPLLEERRDKIRATWSARRDPPAGRAGSPSTGNSSRTRGVNGIIEEARKTAGSCAQIQAVPSGGAATVAKAGEIGAERDRVFQELQGEIGEIASRWRGVVGGTGREGHQPDRRVSTGREGRGGSRKH
jgi:hypothetical protein